LLGKRGKGEEGKRGERIAHLCLKGNGQDLTRPPLPQGLISSDQKIILEITPQKVNYAIQFISRIFPAEGIIVEHGKIATDSQLSKSMYY
jgi:hypothetical protein